MKKAVSKIDSGTQNGKHFCSFLMSFLPLCSRKVARAGGAVPGAVGVSGQAALGAGFPVNVTAVQRQLGHPHHGTDVELLLQKEFVVTAKTILFFKSLLS